MHPRIVSSLQWSPPSVQIVCVIPSLETTVVEVRPHDAGPCSDTTNPFSLAREWVPASGYSMQTMVQDYEQQIAAISKSFKAVEAENEAARDEVQRHYAQQEAEQLLAFQTARAEAGEAASEEYNMLKLSREAQVCTGRRIFCDELGCTATWSRLGAG